MLSQGRIEEVQDEAGGRGRPVVLTKAGKDLPRNAKPAWQVAQAQAQALLGKDSMIAVMDTADRIMNDPPTAGKLCCIFSNEIGHRDMAQSSAETGADDHMDSKPAFTEHYISREQGRVYARDYEGTDPAFVLMHGFPDNLRIWDDLLPYLAASGRRVVTFDFLGFGASDKPTDALYSFKQQLGDLGAVVEELRLGKIVPVAHDSSGMAAINYTLAYPEGVNSIIMLNSAYCEDSTVLWPEMITLFATPSLHDLAMAVAQTPEQLGWLLTWQQRKFMDPLPDAQKLRFSTFLGPLIRDNFIAQPSSAPAFVQVAAQFFDEHARNAARLPQLKTLDIPVKLIWGHYDPYITLDVAERRRAQLKNASLTVVPAGHWLQVDEPEQVAKAMLL